MSAALEIINPWKVLVNWNDISLPNVRIKWMDQQIKRQNTCLSLSYGCPFWSSGKCNQRWPHIYNSLQTSRRYRKDIRRLQFWSFSVDPNELQVRTHDVWSAPDSKLSNQFIFGLIFWCLNSSQQWIRFSSSREWEEREESEKDMHSVQ